MDATGSPATPAQGHSHCSPATSKATSSSPIFVYSTASVVERANTEVPTIIWTRTRVLSRVFVDINTSSRNILIDNLVHLQNHTILPPPFRPHTPNLSSPRRIDYEYLPRRFTLLSFLRIVSRPRLLYILAIFLTLLLVLFLLITVFCRLQPSTSSTHQRIVIFGLDPA